MTKRNKSVTLIIILLLASLFLILGYLYIEDTRNLLISEAEVHIKEVAIQGSQLAQRQIEKDLDILNIFSSYYTSNPNMSNEEKIKKLLDEMENQKFYTMAIVDINGNAENTKGNKFSVKDREFFKNSINGKEYVSSPYVDEVNKSVKKIAISVPILNNDKVVGVLYCTYDVNTLMKLINVSFYENNSISYVVKNNGTVILHPQQDRLSKNIYELLKQDNDIEDVNQLKKQLEKNKIGAAILNMSGERRYLGYATMDNGKSKDNYINDWNLIFSIPESVIFRNSEQIIKRAVYAVLLIIFVFIAIIFYIMYIKKSNEKEILRLAYEDRVTHIGNQNKFYRECSKCLLNKPSLNYIIVYFDIDNFKMINDTFGYEFGDNLLITIARALKEELTEGEIYARLSSDYFAIFCEYKNGRNKIIKKLDSIRNNIENNLNTVFEISLCVGIYFVEEGEVDAQKAVNKANMARSVAKGKNINYAIYNEDVRNKLSEESIILDDIKTALVKNQFEVYYQPKFSLVNGDMIGSEALIRWNHPEHGFISPAIFIPIAEKSQLILKIGRFVFERVCIDLSKWEKQGKKLVPVSVNLSRVELYQPDIVKFINMTIQTYNIHSNLIELEITETVAINELNILKSVLNELRKYGFSISMDDFGTGYSSISCLRDMPIDVLKLDKSFLNGIENDEKSRNIAKSIVSLAKSLDLVVIIEGVESKKQAELMKQFGCDLVQGFYFARPMPVQNFMELL
ncbi:MULTISPECIES: EAL domain-containing protein [unclassified Clostridioides]|uniref:bifunctional diguanylate cyclase/phosphodiesterase n=1 Tax=unclassified Clostridioides TaxID=2635829 RepID=UPI001D1199A4|nr:EAL domain-containing protein [Clostridioides sp. ZZV14-6150]MCC0661631.1 EAL domain-containing protein [Clostridioides sp. ZZV14-6154]MCC0669004.1 EAL domain-containing protein [Clostridioides sp. ZZV14-6153]MCC0718171.1 EAL domain-containing protein [Clostridioides sp. ZZV14-6105]MCC0721512.1 EAL domain-containing protein [Clostridioides sp. ZZV14-6104]MCC0728918.1 EAL domain-containing protein [Clostridioides sp. ZZV14-6045]MCC0731921.1 EAL domain-containing protein [Clostridioides sp. 